MANPPEAVNQNLIPSDQERSMTCDLSSIFHKVFEDLGRANDKGVWIEISKALIVVNMEILILYIYICYTRKKNWKNRRVFIVCIKTPVDL